MSALWLPMGLFAIYIATRAYTLFFSQQESPGRVADAIIIALYGIAAWVLWPVVNGCTP